MNDIKVLLITGGHCIQTSAKKEFMRLADLILGQEEESVPPGTEYRLELLREFLEETDFNSLRSSDERLAGIREGKFLLKRDKAGKPVLGTIE